MNVIDIQRLLATCVEVLVREGLAAEADEAIRQGRKVGAALGPYVKDAPGDEAPSNDDAREIAVRNEALAVFGLPTIANPIKLGA